MFASSKHPDRMPGFDDDDDTTEWIHLPRRICQHPSSNTVLQGDSALHWV